MEMQIIGFKEFRQKLSEIPKKVAKGQGFLVFKNNQPVFEVKPVESGADFQREKEKLLKALEKCKFNSGDPHLSEKIDEIAWGK